jgi:hypothetical protein
MADFAASAGMELFSHIGKFGIFGTRTPPFLTGSGRVSGWHKYSGQFCSVGVETVEFKGTPEDTDRKSSIN